MKKFTLIALALFISLLAHALSYSTPTRQSAHSLAISAGLHYQEHGTLPQNWDEITRYLDGTDIDELFPYVQPSKRYAFVSEPVQISLRDHTKAKIAMMMRSSFRDLKVSGEFPGFRLKGLTKPGRYLILQSENGDMRARFVLETDIRKTFREAGIKLPKLDSLPTFPHEREYQRNRIFLWFGLTLLIAALVYVASALLPKLRSRKSARKPST